MGQAERTETWHKKNVRVRHWYGTHHWIQFDITGEIVYVWRLVPKDGSTWITPIPVVTFNDQNLQQRNAPRRREARNALGASFTFEAEAQVACDSGGFISHEFRKKTGGGAAWNQIIEGLDVWNIMELLGWVDGVGSPRCTLRNWRMPWAPCFQRNCWVQLGMFEHGGTNAGMHEGWFVTEKSWVILILWQPSAVVLFKSWLWKMERWWLHIMVPASPPW